MDPSIKDGKAIINSKVKRREPYRPFGASVLLEETEKLFDCDYESPYMLYVVKCKQKEEFPAIVHVDDTCRIQTVNQDPQNAFYYDLIETFRKKTGIPMVLNTSLNIDGKPIAADPSDAHKLYDISDMDAVVIGNDIRVK
jgi:carbamoyltransferase